MKVKCINDTGVTFGRITTNVIYEVVKDYREGETYRIIDNFGAETCWNKSRFKIMNEYSEA